MQLIVYGDFNCPFSYLASQRVDALAQLGSVEVEWRAVEHDRGLPLTGMPSNTGTESWRRELAEAGEIARPGEKVPATAPPMISNTGAAVAAYAEAVTDGIQDELRRELFETIWVHQRHLSSPYEVRQLVRTLMYSAEPQSPHLSTPDLPSRVHRHPDPDVLPRLSGCTIATDGGPLTTAGFERIRQWRREWQPAAGGVIPALVLPDGMLTGVAALSHLGDLTASTPGAGQPAAAS